MRFLKMFRISSELIELSEIPWAKLSRPSINTQAIHSNHESKGNFACYIYLTTSKQDNCVVIFEKATTDRQWLGIMEAFPWINLQLH